MGTTNVETQPEFGSTNGNQSNFYWLLMILDLKKNTDHIIESIIKYYPVNVDCTGGLYCIIKLECTYYPTRSIDLSMSKYATNKLHEFQHPYPKRPQMNYANGNAQTM